VCLSNLKLLKEQQGLRDKLSEVFVNNYDNDETVDPEHALYSGSFFSTSDKAQMEILHSLTPEQLANHEFNFQDARLPTLLFRYRARNYPYTLSTNEQQQWQSYCQNKLQNGGKGILSLDEFMMKIENLAHELDADNESNQEKMQVLKALYEYVQG